MTNEERFDRESKKLDSARQEGQDKVDGLNSELRAAEAAGNAALTGELRTQLEEAKARAAKLEEGQKVIDTARDRATDTGGRMGNITVNVTTGAVNVGQNEVKGGDGEWKYETVDEKGNVSYNDEPGMGDPWGGVGSGGYGTPPPSDSGGFGTQPASPTSTPTQTTSPTPTQTTPTQTTSTPTQQPSGDGTGKPGTGQGTTVENSDGSFTTTKPDGTKEYLDPDLNPTPNNQPYKPPVSEQPKPGTGGGATTSPDVYINPNTGQPWQPWHSWPNGSDGKPLPKGPDGKPVPEGSTGGQPKPAGEPGTEGVPGPTGQQGPSGQGQPGTGLPGLGGGNMPGGQPGGLPGLGGGGYQGGHPFLGTEQFTSGNPWGQGSYNDFMQSQLAGGENEGLAGLADAAGGSGMGGMQTTGIVRGDEGGMSAMGRLGAAAGQPQAQVFPGNAMMGQVAQPQAGGQPAGGQQLAAGPPINDQQMEGMMQVMPNVGGDGSALGLGMGGQMAIYQQQLAKQQEMIDASNNQGGGGLVGGGYGGGGGTQGGGSGGDGSGQRPRPWGQDVVTPSYDPRDPGNQGGGRPLPGVPGASGPGGILNPDLFTRNSGDVNSGQDWRQEQADKEAADKKWQGWDFAKQGDGSSFTDDGVSEFVKNTRESGVPTASHPGGQFQPSGMPAFPNPGGFNDTPAPAGLSQLSQQASGRFSPGGSHDQMVAQANQRAGDSYAAQVAAGGHQDYIQRFGGTSMGGRGTYEQQRAAWDAGNANRQAVANAQQKNRQSLSNQSSGGGVVSSGMPWAPGQGPAPGGPAVLPKGGLSSLATKAKPRNITLNQMYRK